jgi:hypothetical protein
MLTWLKNALYDWYTSFFLEAAWPSDAGERPLQPITLAPSTTEKAAQETLRQHETRTLAGSTQLRCPTWVCPLCRTEVRVMGTGRQPECPNQDCPGLTLELWTPPERRLMRALMVPKLR